MLDATAARTIILDILHPARRERHPSLHAQL